MHDFMPVRKVNYSVEDARGDGSCKERLILEIGQMALTPQEALSSAANILVDQSIKDISLEAQKDELPTDEPTSQIPIEAAAFRADFSCL